MTFAKRIAGAVALGMGMLIGSGLSSQAGYVVTLEQQGPNVVATGSGPIDLTGLSSGFVDGFNRANIEPGIAQILTGPTSEVLQEQFGGFTGPESFGSGDITFANSGTGDFVGISSQGSRGPIVLPVGYVSDSPLSDTSTYDNATFASLGAIPGTYEWTWGSGPDQNFTLIIGAAAVPEPASSLLLGVALGVLVVRALASRVNRFYVARRA
jgi:hypothetical protein